ncbi:phosphoglucosamine mutase, partial [Candidatus Parvarchaeota archaeon]|nr:phosphoglucosamine mutase [Candidatus Parvarchaeota archaeon]
MELSFGTNGVRGTFDRLTPLEAVKFSRAFGQWVQQTLGKKPSIILACDHRLTSPLLHSAALSGLLSSGADVIDIGLAPSPTAELMIHRLGAQGALVVTASHNPPEWNALKFVDWDGVAISRERGGQISKLLQSKGAQSLKIGRTSAYPGALDAHRQTILNSVDKQVFAGRQLKVVIDCANGTASLVAPYVFGDLGCTVITLNSHIDGTFPGRPSEPTEANLKDLKAAVVASKADLGIAFDGDSDRVIFIDEKGGFVVGDKGFALSL